jgi:hypothetical protein
MKKTPGRGRPADPRKKKLVRFDPALFQRIEASATTNRRDMNAEIHFGMERYLERTAPVLVQRKA